MDDPINEILDHIGDEDEDEADVDAAESSSNTAVDGEESAEEPVVA